MANMNIEGTLGSMFKGMDGFISSKSVVGEPVYVGDTIIIPLVDVNFGMAAGAFNKQDGNKAAGGIGAKMSPSAVLVVSGGNTRLVNLKNQDAVTKIIDMAPEVVDKVVGLFKKDKTEEEKNVDKAINDVAQSEESVRIYNISKIQCVGKCIIKKSPHIMIINHYGGDFLSGKNSQDLRFSSQRWEWL